MHEPSTPMREVENPGEPTTYVIDLKLELVCPYRGPVRRCPRDVVLREEQRIRGGGLQPLTNSFAYVLPLA